MTKEDEKTKCAYCGKTIHKIEAEINNGYCSKCAQTKEWKKLLKDVDSLQK